MRVAAIVTVVLLAGCGRGTPTRVATPPDTAHAVVASDTSAPPAPAGEPAPDSTTASAAADVVRAYYAAIVAHDSPRAWRMWGQDGVASGQTLAQFAAGFAHTRGVAVAFGAPGAIEGAAGSRYCEIPVTVNAVTDRGARQRFVGRYVMRRADVDGATPSQRRWHIDAAHLRRE